MEIDGQTRVIPHLAFPSAHLKTPPLFNARCRALGINAAVVPWEVAPGDLAGTMAALRAARSVAGMIVTIPHKETVTAHCDRLEGVAVHLAVANIIRRGADGRLTGALFDGTGFVAGLKSAGISPQGQGVLLLGAGGAATAIAQALLDAGVDRLVIANRTIPRAESLVSRLRALNPGREISVGPADGRGFALVVNGTSVGLAGDPASPLTPEMIDPASCVAEVIMSPEWTPLLLAAQARGARVHLGKHMLSAQIDQFIAFLLPVEASAAGLTAVS